MPSIVLTGLRLLRGQAQVSCSATFSVLPADSPLSIAPGLEIAGVCLGVPLYTEATT